MSAAKVSSGRSKPRGLATKGSMSGIDQFVEAQVAAFRAAAKECHLSLSDLLRPYLRHCGLTWGIEVSEQTLIKRFREGLREELYRMLPERRKQSRAGFIGSLSRIQQSADLLGRIQSERDRLSVNDKLPRGAVSKIAKGVGCTPDTASRLLKELRRLEQESD